MKAFDTDVLTEILLGNAEFVRRAALIPTQEQGVPVVVAEEIIRGRLNAIRQAEAGKGRLTIEQVYELFERTLHALREVTILPYTSRAEDLFQQWRRQKLRLPTHDLRIAAISVAHSATLVSRNRRDFERVPGLTVEYW
ncbi:MAG TPA: type II toxin-antitoxin system VapC family toxin [Gemmataceae bacterium]|nr:type II toxin-antitoxin system VapC family toxin [Gemmataceae bacterium]